MSNASLQDEENTVKIIHPFSPLKGKTYKVIERNTAWCEDRLLCSGENGEICRILTAWTDYLPPDAFVEQSKGRADFTFEGLVELAEFMRKLTKKLST